MNTHVPASGVDTWPTFSDTGFSESHNACVGSVPLEHAATNASPAAARESNAPRERGADMAYSWNGLRLTPDDPGMRHVNGGTTQCTTAPHRLSARGAHFVPATAA